MLLQKPEWLKIRPPTEHFLDLKKILKENKLHTVCEESHCPNISECWSGGTATFMVLGDTCTRGCRFCHVKSGYPKTPPDPNEPAHLAQAVTQMKLDYVVITSVDRDDLADQGSSHFAACIKAIKQLSPSIHVEVLIPDFRGNKECIKTIVEAHPDVIAHNLETVKRLQGKVRDHRANYEQSLSVLKTVKELNPKIYTKSALMLGLGEGKEELLEAFTDLRAINTDILTLGQYLQPTPKHLPVAEFIHPDVFAKYKEAGLSKGFRYVGSGPLVRSSYHAEKHVF